MKASCYIFVFLLMFSPVLLNSQSACEPGSELESCAPSIPTLTEVITGFKTYSNETLKCYWVCPGDSLRLEAAVQCNIFLETNSYLFLTGNLNYVWAKKDAKVVLSVDALNTNAEILQNVNYNDDGMNTTTTICPSLVYDYVFAPAAGCDLTSIDPELEIYAIDFYPNPVNGNSSIVMSTNETIYSEINLLNSFGKIVKKWKLEGQKKINLALEGTSPGVYLIQIPNSNVIEKIVVF